MSDQFEFELKQREIYEQALKIACKELEKFTHVDAELLQENLEGMARTIVNDTY